MKLNTAAKVGITSGYAILSGKATVEEVEEDLRNFDFFNTDPQKCIDAHVFSSYNGTPVIKHSFGSGSMSVCNTIFLSKNTSDEDIVRHEYGHTIQQALLGNLKFMAHIGVPSLIGAAFSVNDYYSQPWERSADFFGGVQNHDYNIGARASGILSCAYFILSVVS